MPVYKYKAKSAEGKNVVGSLVALNEQAVASRLDQMGYVPISIGVDKTGGKASSSGFLQDFFKPSEKVKERDLIAFTRQFATIVKAGVPIVTGLTILSEQTESDSLRTVLQKVVHDIEGGSSLSQGLDKHPKAFNEMYVSTVVAGEAGGVLDTVLLRLASLMERDHETSSNVSAALMYPKMTVIALLIAMTTLIQFVVPKFNNMYAKFEATLPLPTRVLIAANHIITDWWYIALPSVIGLSLLFKQYLKTSWGRMQWDGFLLKLPVFGELFMKVSMSRFASMLSTLNESGLPILRSLEIVANTVGNTVVGDAVDKVRKNVADGRGISESITQLKLFPPLVAHMISIGEKTGSMDEMLNSINDYYDLEIKNTVKNLTVTIEPIMTAILGGVVLGMALAIFLPLWNMIALFQS